MDRNFKFLVRTLYLAPLAEPTLPFDIYEWKQGADKSEDNRIDEAVLPGKLRHDGKIHAVECRHQSWRKKHGCNDRKDLNDLILLDIENVCYRALQIPDFVVLKGKVFLHAGDIVDKLIDQDLKFRFRFVADFSAEVSGGTRKRELRFQASRDQFLLIIKVERRLSQVDNAQLSSLF